jgi:hypothetical protein
MVACRTYQYYSFNLLKRFWEKEAEENKDSTLKNCKSRSEIRTSNYKYSPESFLYTQKWLKCRSQLRFWGCCAYSRWRGSCVCFCDLILFLKIKFICFKLCFFNIFK